MFALDPTAAQAAGWATAAALLAAWAYILLSAPRRPSSTLPRPPSAGWPLIGDTLAALEDSAATRSARHAQLGPVFAARFMGRRYTSVRGVALVKKLLQAEHVTVETAW